MGDIEVGDALTVTVPVAAEKLGVSLKTFKRMIDRGEISYIQRDRNCIRLIEVDELRRWIATYRQNAQSSPSESAPAPAAEPVSRLSRGRRPRPQPRTSAAAS